MIGVLLIFTGGILQLLLILLGGSILLASVLFYRTTHKRYASTWAFTATGSESVTGGPYREGQIPVTRLVQRDAPGITRVAAFSGLALSLYLAIFLPFFLPIVFESSTAAGLSIVLIAVGVATRRSALGILDGSAPPGATSEAVATVLFMTACAAFLPWGSLRHPASLPIALFQVAVPIWTAVQGGLILVAARSARRLTQGG